MLFLLCLLLCKMVIKYKIWSGNFMKADVVESRVGTPLHMWHYIRFNRHPNGRYSLLISGGRCSV